MGGNGVKGEQRQWQSIGYEASPLSDLDSGASNVRRGLPSVVTQSHPQDWPPTIGSYAVCGLTEPERHCLSRARDTY